MGKCIAILTVRIDLAKKVFTLHRINEAGKPDLVRPTVTREQLKAALAALPPCVIGIDTSSGVNQWARELQALDHAVRLITPRFVMPYCFSGRRGKNDAAVAADI